MNPSLELTETVIIKFQNREKLQRVHSLEPKKYVPKSFLAYTSKC